MLQLRFKTVRKPAKASLKKESKTASSRPENSTAADRDKGRPSGPGNGDVVPKEAEGVQQDGVLASLDIRMTLPNVQTAPMGVKLAQPDMKMVPLDMQMVPLEMQMVPLEMQMVPLEMQMAPLEMKMVPLDMNMVPLDIKMAPIDVKLAKNVKSGLRFVPVKSCVIATACLFSMYGLYKLMS